MRPFRPTFLSLFSSTGLFLLALSGSVFGQTAPPNDNFANRYIIGGFPRIVYANNIGATAEIDEPEYAEGRSPNASVWWTWISPTNGLVDISTLGSDFETTIAVYTGSTLTTLQRIDSSYIPGLGHSRIRFPAEMNQHYHVALGSSYNGQGSIQLNFEPTPPPPANDDFSNRITLTGLPVQISAINRGASSEPGELRHDYAHPLSTVWWSWTAPFSGGLEVNTFGSDFDTTLGVFTGETLETLTTVAGSGFTFLPDHSWTNAASANITIFEGTTYHIAVGGDTYFGNNGDEGMLNLNLLAISGPTNDHFANRTHLQGLPVSTTGNNYRATYELNEPDYGGYGPRFSVWWSWTAPISVKVDIDLSGSYFDTIMGVYTGTTLETLQEIDYNDNAGMDSRVRIDAVAGVEYQIVVDGRFDESGHIQVNISPTPANTPPNDDFSARIPLTGFPASALGSTIHASTELGEPVHTAQDDRASSIWWSWTSPWTGTIIADASLSDYDPVLAVYSGDTLNTLIPEGEQVSPPNSYYLSIVRFQAMSGTVYHIAADGYMGTEGNVVLNIRQDIPAAANDLFGAARPLPSSSLFSTLATNVGATIEVMEPLHDGRLPSGTLWWTWTAPFSGIMNIDTRGSLFDTLLTVFEGDSIATLAPVRTNDDFFERQSAVRFIAELGTVYRIAVGGLQSEGVIHLQGESLSPPFIRDIVPDPSGGFHLSWYGLDNEIMRIQQSSNLTDWTVFTNVVMPARGMGQLEAGANADFIFHPPPGASPRFYRVDWTPN